MVTLPISPYETTLLTAAWGKSEDAVLAWNQLAYQQPPAEWPKPWQRLLPAIWQNLKDQPREALVYRDRLARTYGVSWGANMRLRDEICELVSFLESFDIPTLLLKGLWVGLATGRDIGARPTADIDLLVPYEQAEMALEVLSQNGWAANTSKEVRVRERLYHATDLSKDGVGLDLHWFLLPESRSPGCDAGFWDRAEQMRLGDTTVRGLAPSDLLFHLLVLLEREPEQRIRYYSDLVSVWSKCQDQVCLDHVESLLRARHLLTRGLPVLEALRGPSPSKKVSWLDKAWSQSSQAIYDGSHEFHYALYPFLDYYLHYRSGTPDWSLSQYLQHRLEIEGGRDLADRSAKKILRTLFGSTS